MWLRWVRVVKKWILGIRPANGVLGQGSPECLLRVWLHRVPPAIGPSSLAGER